MLSSVSRLIKHRDKSVIDLSNMVDSTAKFFGKKTVLDEGSHMQNVNESSKVDVSNLNEGDTPTISSNTEEVPVEERASSFLKKPFKKFSINIRKSAPTAGSTTDGSSVGSSTSSEEIQRENRTSEVASSVEKKSMFGGFTRRKTGDSKLKPMNKLDVFKKNPFATFGRNKSKTKNYHEEEAEEISFGVIAGNDASAFDIGNLSDEDES